MKKTVVFLLAVLSVALVHAQKGKKDIVYLKSGAIIRGQVVTYDLDAVKINSAGNEWVFKATDIDSVSRKFKRMDEPVFSPAYYFDAVGGVLVGNSGNSQKAPFSYSNSFNYRLMDKLYTGIGLGVDFLDETYMPAFAQIQYKFRNTKFTPFVNLQAGYEIPLEKKSRKNFNNYYVTSDYNYYNSGYQRNEELDNEGGFLIHPSLGFMNMTSENFGWFFAFGYRYHKLNYSGKNEYRLETNYSRLSLKIGFIFN
jgi:hypothetical protein